MATSGIGPASGSTTQLLRTSLLPCLTSLLASWFELARGLESALGGNLALQTVSVYRNYRCWMLEELTCLSGSMLAKPP